MAKIQIIRAATEHNPPLTEIIEVRIWALGGAHDMPFYIGSGVNSQADSNIWLEILYTVEGAQLYYTRNFIHLAEYRHSTSTLQRKLKNVAEKGGEFTLRDIMPATYLKLINKEDAYPSQSLTISADTGAVFGRAAPEMRSIDIVIDLDDVEEGARFMRQIIREIGAVRKGKHPDPASFPPGSSDWPFAWQLNRAAYDKISERYQDDLFENPLLAEAFDSWLAQIPPGGHILDAGCGHGNPVIARLLEKGFQVTGSDFSPAMLRRAAQQFPQAAFLHQATPAIDQQEAYDGVCSFNSMLYLDPVDFLHSVYRLHCALKPGGRLFLYAYDSGPSWRGSPLGHRVGEWMWSWHYGMEEAAHLLEEHGYFKVLDMRKVKVDEEEAERIEQELAKQKKEEEEYYQRQESEPNENLPFKIPFFKNNIERSPYTYEISARRK